MSWLVEANLAATGQLDGGLNAPYSLFNFCALHFLSWQRIHERRQVIAHAVQNGSKEIMFSVKLREPFGYEPAPREQQWFPWTSEKGPGPSLLVSPF
jgi:hypothetical protein